MACPEKTLCYKGLTFTPGGFLALETVTRSRNLASDVDTPYGAIPFRQNRAGRTGEFRFSARQSRISGLVEGNADPFTHLSGYGEFDFLGAAQTSASATSTRRSIAPTTGCTSWPGKPGPSRRCSTRVSRSERRRSR